MCPEPQEVNFITPICPPSPCACPTPAQAISDNGQPDTELAHVIDVTFATSPAQRAGLERIRRETDHIPVERYEAGAELPERRRPAEMGTGSVVIEGPGGAEPIFRSMPGAPVEDLSMELGESPFAQSPIMPSEMRLTPDVAPPLDIRNVPQGPLDDMSQEFSEIPLSEPIIMPSEMPPAPDTPQPAPVQIVTNGFRQPNGIVTAANAQPIETLPDAYSDHDLSKDLVIS